MMPDWYLDFICERRLTREVLHANRAPTMEPMVDPKGAQAVYTASALFRLGPSGKILLIIASPFGA